MKSEKAMEVLRTVTEPCHHADGEITTYHHHDLCYLVDVIKAIELAEAEAEERHATDIEHYRRELAESKERERIANQIIADKRKEIEGMEERAVEAFCQSMSIGFQSSCKTDRRPACQANCAGFRNFIQKLKEK